MFFTTDVVSDAPAFQMSEPTKLPSTGVPIGTEACCHPELGTTAPILTACSRPHQEHQPPQTLQPPQTTQPTHHLHQIQQLQVNRDNMMSHCCVFCSFRARTCTDVRMVCTLFFLHNRVVNSVAHCRDEIFVFFGQWVSAHCLLFCEDCDGPIEKYVSRQVGSMSPVWKLVLKSRARHSMSASPPFSNLLLDLSQQRETSAAARKSRTPHFPNTSMCGSMTAGIQHVSPFLELCVHLTHFLKKCWTFQAGRPPLVHGGTSCVALLWSPNLPIFSV